MRTGTVVAALALLAMSSSSVHAQRWLRWERVISDGSGLVGLCREKAEARYIALGEPVYQWTGSYHDYANMLYADGTLRVDGRDVEVHCHMPHNARERHLAMEVVDPGK